MQIAVWQPPTFGPTIEAAEWRGFLALLALFSVGRRIVSERTSSSACHCGNPFDITLNHWQKWRPKMVRELRAAGTPNERANSQSRHRRVLKPEHRLPPSEAACQSLRCAHHEDFRIFSRKGRWCKFSKT